jgi:sigma-B regulation protein RsbU (phosphoserine phosphatase)
VTREQLKNDKQTTDIPILFLTGLSDDEHRTRGYRLGAVDYVSKPFSKDEMLARANVHLHNGMLNQRLKDYYQRVSTEMDKARRFQLGLLPSAQAVAQVGADYGLDLDITFTACEELAGDYWQLFPLNENQLAIALVDFTGHGVTAALNTATIHTLFLEVEDRLSDPSALLAGLNERLCKLMTVDSFATCWYGIYDKITQELTYTSHGAMPPYHIKNGKINPLPSAGIPLGLVDYQATSPTTATVKLKPDDALLLYSDALVEAIYNDGNRRFEDGAKALVQQQLAQPKLATAIKQAAEQEFQQPLLDDLTILALKLR